jgi:hypothetical protein
VYYAYEKNGSCALLAVIEPLTGFRLAQVHPQRTKKEYSQFFQALAAESPNASAFYENLPADEAQALAHTML